MSVFHLLILFIQLLHCAQAVLKKKKTAAEKSDKREKSIVPSTFFVPVGEVYWVGDLLLLKHLTYWIRLKFIWTVVHCLDKLL